MKVLWIVLAVVLGFMAIGGLLTAFSDGGAADLFLALLLGIGSVGCLTRAQK